jgi:hypothetical protein
MRTRKYVRRDEEYKSVAQLFYENLDTDDDIEEPVVGYLTLWLSDDVPLPVDIEIRDIEKQSAEAQHAKFDTRSRSVSSHDEYPVKFRFESQPEATGGGKWFSYRTAEWPNTSMEESKDNPEFVKHHIGIPTARKIRLTNRILEDEHDEQTLSVLMDVYGGSQTSAAQDFSSDLKKYVPFQEKAQVQDYLSDKTGFERTRSQTVNKVAKQLTESEFQHRVASLEDVHRMVDHINNLPNLPDITVEEVFREVVDRSDKRQLDAIGERLDIDDWSTVLDI